MIMNHVMWFIYTHLGTRSSKPVRKSAFTKFTDKVTKHVKKDKEMYFDIDEDFIKVEAADVDSLGMNTCGYTAHVTHIFNLFDYISLSILAL